MGKQKYTKDEVIEIYKSYNLILESTEKYINVKSKMTAYTKEGYKVYVSIDNLRNGKPSVFGKGNPYTIWNIKNIWLPANAPDYELLSDTYVNNYSKLLWKLKNSNLEPFEMSWANFMSGNRHPALQYEKIGDKQKLKDHNEKIKILLKKYNPEWEFIGDYKNNHSPLLFKNKEGYLAMRTYTNLKRSKNKLHIFNKFYPETSTYNMYKYVKENCENIILLEGQIFTGMHSEYHLECNEHGKFTVLWVNFFYREQGCPQCLNLQRSKGEKKITEWLNQNSIKYETQYTFDDLIGVGGRKLRFDFAIFNAENSIISLIEFQGGQHYKPIEWFGGEKSFERLIANDNFKIKYCKNKNIPLIQISYNELNNIEEILNSHILSNIVSRLYQ